MKGVYRLKDTKGGTPRWRAAIRVQSKWVHLGIFQSEIEARCAHVEADSRLRNGWGEATPFERALQRIEIAEKAVASTDATETQRMRGLHEPQRSDATPYPRKQRL